MTHALIGLNNFFNPDHMPGRVRVIFIFSRAYRRRHGASQRAQFFGLDYLQRNIDYVREYLKPHIRINHSARYAHGFRLFSP